MLNRTYSRGRQKRLLQVLNDRKLDALVLGLAEHVYYATTHKAFWLQSAAFVLLADGRSIVSTGNSRNESAEADEIVSFEASWMGTQRQEQPAVVAEQVNEILKDRHVKRVGVDASAVSSQLMLQSEAEFESIDAEVWQLRRSKWPDEVQLMRQAVRCTEAMYRRAKEIIEPELGEIELFTQLHAAAVKESGEPMTALLGNDYACGVGGGPPRKDHFAEAGQLWVLDLGPSYRGYFADNARVFSVDGKLTDAQQQAWQTIVEVFPIVEKMARPGVRCQAIFQAIDEHFQSRAGKGLAHHLGHGVGLGPHEFPHLNLKWDDVLVEGDVFTVEPGLYGKEINGGIRLENEYLVTAAGVENLVNFPLEMT
jgi:Xaa-Pro aminopeptidase